MFTNRNLLNYANELAQIEQKSILRILLNGRIKEFKKTNQERINSLYKDIDKLQKAYLTFAPDGNIEIENPESPPQEQKPKIIEGKTMAEYDEAINELMNKPVNINF